MIIEIMTVSLKIPDTDISKQGKLSVVYIQISIMGIRSYQLTVHSILQANLCLYINTLTSFNYNLKIKYEKSCHCTLLYL